MSLAALSACQGNPVKRNPASAPLDPTIEQLANYLKNNRHKDGPYWAAPFTSDVTSDALMLALGKRIGKLKPEDAESYAQSMFERMTTEQNTNAHNGWPAYAGGPTDFNITAIALLCLKSAGFGGDQKDDFTHFDNRFQTAANWFVSQGGMGKLHKGADQLYARLMLDPLDLINPLYNPILTPNSFGMPSTFPVHFDRDGFLRGLIAPSIGIRYLESLPDNALAEYSQTAEQWRQMTPEMGRYHVDNPDNVGSKKCLPAGDVKTFLADVAAHPEKYKDCLFISQHKGKPFAKKLWNFFREPISNHVMDAMNFVIRGTITGTPAYWTEQALILDLQLLNPEGAWYTVGFTMCNMRLLQEAQRVGLGNFQNEMDQAWQTVLATRTVNQDKQLIQPWVLTGTWDTASTLVAFAPLRGTTWALPDADANASVKWLLAHSIQNGNSRGWSFDETDATLPDVDDTAIVLLALSLYPTDDLLKTDTVTQAVSWLTSRQNKDGGYPAWSTSMSKFLVDLLGTGDRRELFSVLADFSQPDVTARVMFAFQNARAAAGAPIDEIKAAQDAGCKYLMHHMDEMKDRHLRLSAGNWMVNYVYSAASVLNGLVNADCGEEKQAELAQFVMDTQQKDSGGWGEAPTGYLTSSYVPAKKPTTMQTAVAVSGLMAYYDELNRKHKLLPPTLVQDIENGVEFLVKSAQGVTHPTDDEYNGVLIRGVTFARYELAPTYLALYALGRWRQLRPASAN